MEGVFSENGLAFWYFAEISTVFVLTLLVFFDRRIYLKRKWIHHLLFGSLVVWWILAVAFKSPVTRVFATLMVASAVFVESVITRQRRRENR